MSEKPSGPCGNEDCDKCYPLPRFKVGTLELRWELHEREIKAASEEEALRIYEEGTAWPSSYDERTVEVLETKPTTIERVENSHRGGLCYNDIKDDGSFYEGTPDPLFDE